MLINPFISYRTPYFRHSYPLTRDNILYNLALSYSIFSYSYPALFFRVLFILSCPILFYLSLSYPLYCPVLFCLIYSYPVLSCSIESYFLCPVASFPSHLYPIPFCRILFCPISSYVIPPCPVSLYPVLYSSVLHSVLYSAVTYTHFCLFFVFPFIPAAIPTSAVYPLVFYTCLISHFLNFFLYLHVIIFKCVVSSEITQSTVYVCVWTLNFLSPQITLQQTGWTTEYTRLH